jgi:rubredoxin
MSLERAEYCPECGEERTFYRAASTELHLGEKVKWRCPECNWGFVVIEDVVDTSQASA